MADGNGKDNTQQRLDALEQMDKLLLRAQVLQQNALEQLQRATQQFEKTQKQHSEWQERHEKQHIQWQERHEMQHEQSMREAEDRERRLDQRIDKLVSSIGDLISRIPPENLR